MKRVNSILAIILFLMTGCGGTKQSNDDFITIDVTKSYPKKELILQDFMDVEYIALETSRDFLCQGLVQAIGKDMIIVRNSVNDGDIFIFDRNGKGLRKINRMGRGGEEYLSIYGFVLDEKNKEMFVMDYSSRIMVYDLYGIFRRSLKQVEGREYGGIYNFDDESIICSDFYYDGETKDNSSFFIISKQDGSIIKDIHIPFEQRKSTIMIQIAGDNAIAVPIQKFPIIPYQDSWILTEPSSDTIFKFTSDFILTPFWVRTPTVQSMNPEIFLFPEILTDRYYFMKTVKKEFDFSTGRGFPETHLVYEKQEKTINECIVYNNDFSTKRPIEMSQRPLNNEIIFWQKLEADDLFDAYKEGQLKGKLKEIAAGLKEEDNPVIMLVKYKK